MSLKLTALVFDETIQADANSPTYYTPATLNERLAQYDKLGIMAVSSNVSGGAVQTITVRLQVSGDGRLWANKNQTAEINAQAMSTTAETAIYGGDASSSASMGFVRLAFSLSASTTARVKLYVTARDPLQ